MKIYETSSLDNTQCEYAANLGYTHILFDGKLYQIVNSKEYGYDWIQLVMN